MLSNAWFATVASAASAVLGFIFWSVCARQLSAETVGLASATISALNLVALLAELGLGTLLMGHIAKNGEVQHGLASAALVVGTGFAALAAVAWLVLVDTFGFQISAVISGPLPSLLFALGVMVGTVTLIIDGALFGLLKTILHMYRELFFAFCKLILLLLLVFLAGHEAEHGTGILALWAISGAIALVFVGTAIKRSGALHRHRPTVSALIPLLPTSLEYHCLNIAARASALAMPLVVAEVISPEANAVFFISWMMVHVSLLATDSLATAVFAIDKFDEQGRVTRITFALLASTLVCVAGAVAYFFLVNPVLGLLNPTYPEIAGSSIKYLGLGMVAWSIMAQFMAVMRLEGRMRYAATVFAVGATLELVAAAVGGALFGLSGLVGAVLVALYIQAIFMLPYILRAANIRLSFAV